MLTEITIVGSGAAGAAAALGFADHGLCPTVVDVGIEAPTEGELRDNFYQLQQQQDLFDVMIGPDLERVRARSRHACPLPAKLTAPRIRFVTQDAAQLQPLRERGFAAIRSFARGGLANAWGAGLYRALDQDLAGFPVCYAELSPHYDRLTAEIGISGESDDLEPFFGTAAGLQPALRLSKKAAWLLAHYQRARSRFNTAGFFLGRPRLGVLSQPHAGRAACNYSNLEFWEPNLPFIYTPRWTLNRLIQENRVSYRQGLLVKSWSQADGNVVVQARDVATGAAVSWATRFLVLAAGAIGSARLALAAARDYRTKLPLLDNAARQFPLVLPRFIGRSLETDCFGLTQLNLVYQTDASAPPLQASILEITSPAKTEFFAALPLAARDNLRMIRHLVPAMLVMQLFFPAGPEHAAQLSLSPDGAVEIEGVPFPVDGLLIKRFVRTMRKLGALTAASLVVVPPPGQQGIHYAGTLPMSATGDGPYQCDRFCRLHGPGNVYVVDGSVLPHLPAKNCSLLVMANALRVAGRLAGKLRSNT